VTGVICTGRIVTLTTVFVLFRKEVLERGMSVRILKASHLFEVIFFFFTLFSNGGCEKAKRGGGWGGI
jgi:hypothetical protein